MYCTIGPLAFTAFLLSILNQVSAHGGGAPQDVGDTERLSKLQEKWGTDWAFHGISTFAHLPHKRCLTDLSEKFDIGIIGAPFDNAVSYRPGARFGPRAIRAASARQLPFRGFNHRAGLNPYQSWAHVLDCGDIPITPFDNAMAERQMTEAFRELLGRTTIADEERRPRLLTLGGDHSIALPALRALHDIYGRITVVHFDAHLDTWHPGKYPNAWLAGDSEHEQSFFNHGSMFWIASRESLLSNASVHAGLRTRLSGDDYADYADDDAQGWLRIASDDIDDLGVTGIANTIVQHIGEDAPVYLSVDIDVIDPGLAPGTGTPEPGGWLSRELIRILRGIESLNVVGADIVEVSPAFDGTGEETALVAAQVGFEIVTSMVARGIKEDVLKKGSAEAYSRATEPKKGKATAKAGDIKDEL